MFGPGLLMREYGRWSEKPDGALRDVGVGGVVLNVTWEIGDVVSGLLLATGGLNPEAGTRCVVEFFPCTYGTLEEGTS